ncbi:MAG: zinc-binding alcohol dehydrogenase, partial [Anaerolineae bacterium]|nr:zinc-binding alcohol dehydrogenase [Anaerolineae bacterium]
MKAVLQNYGSGDLSVAEVPVPAAQPQRIVVLNHASLVSAGTEKLMVELAQKSLVGKAVERPDLVRQVIDKVRRDGIGPTWQTVRSRLDTPVPLGYSCAGTVLAVGPGVQGFQPGDRVACAGAGYASHAEAVTVPENLAVPLPDGVGFEAAAFVTLGAIALQGIRLAEPQLGEVVAVIGLGLLGQLTVQMLKAAGCLALGLDPQPARANLAMQLGAEAAFTEASALEAAVARYTGGHGADAVLITAGTKSNQPIELAGELARAQGHVIVVGAVSIDIPRKPFYEKELIVRISRAYGPGRYDPAYEEQGHDYPFGYVRWTENRNMRAFITLLAQGRVAVTPLVTHHFDIADAERAYELITGK